MSATHPFSDSASQRVQLRRLDRICDTFEAAWIAGPAPAIEKYLGDSLGPERAELLGELIRIDVHYRRKLGETPVPADYLRRFPTLPHVLLTEAIGISVPNVGAVLNGYEL